MSYCAITDTELMVYPNPWMQQTCEAMAMFLGLRIHVAGKNRLNLWRGPNFIYQGTVAQVSTFLEGGMSARSGYAEFSSETVKKLMDRQEGGQP